MSQPLWIVLGLLWLAGAALRMTILAVPPVILLVAADLHLSGTEIGFLSGLPSILLACAALPGALLISRFGALWTLVAGLLITAIASALRGAVLSSFALYAATAVMSAGIAIMQPALPPLVRQWLPQRVSFATAVFTNGLLVGETLAVMLTIPLVLPMVHELMAWCACGMEHSRFLIAGLMSGWRRAPALAMAAPSQARKFAAGGRIGATSRFGGSGFCSAASTASTLRRTRSCRVISQSLAGPTWSGPRSPPSTWAKSPHLLCFLQYPAELSGTLFLSSCQVF